MLNRVNDWIVSQERRYTRPIAIGYFLFGQVIFILMIMCVGLMRKHSSPYQIVTGRMAIGFILNNLYCKLQKISITPNSPHELKLLIWRGLMGAGGMIFFFGSFKYLNASDAVVLADSNPIWTQFLAAMFLGEKLAKLSLLSAFIGFIGVIFITRPSVLFGESIQYHLDEGRDQFIGSIFGMCSSICISIMIIIMSKLQRKHSVNGAAVLQYTYIITSLLSSICQTQQAFNLFSFSSYSCLMILAIGVTGWLSQQLFARSYSLEKASIISPLQYIEVLMSFFVDIFFFDEHIYGESILGSLFILISCMASLTA